MTTTITEALAEVKTINARIEKKREFILANLARQELQKDPLSGQGGTKAVIERELQAITDLHARLVKIRSAINEANQDNRIVLFPETRITPYPDTEQAHEHSIADWITWKREVAPQLRTLWDSIQNQINSVRAQATTKGFRVVERGIPEKDSDVVLNIDLQQVARQREQLEEILGKLDGLLSLKNATITIEV